jgi:hypothetical protein
MKVTAALEAEEGKGEEPIQYTQSEEYAQKFKNIISSGFSS